jgi:TatD DNase family protein
VSSKKKEIIYPELGPGCRLVDTHCHLDLDSYRDDLATVLNRASSFGVSRIVTVGIDLESSRRAVSLADSNPGISAAVGVHPHHAATCGADDLVELEALSRHPKVVALGEIGLDLHYDFSPFKQQLECFSRQLELARNLRLPVIIHDREAHKEVLEILQGAGSLPGGGVMHCFSGDSVLAEKVMALGYYISIPGVVTFSKAIMLQEAVRQVPLDRLLLETDGPYLAPEPRRGRRNEPALLLFTAARVAELKEISLDDLAEATSANAARLFNLSPDELRADSSRLSRLA